MQGTKRRAVRKRSAFHCLEMLSSPVSPGRVTVAGAETRVRDTESRVPAPRPSRRVRRKASRALRGVRARRDQRPEPREKARLRSAAGRLPAPCPAPLPGPGLAGARAAPGRRRRNAEGGVRRARPPAGASLSPFPLPRGAWAQPALGAAFSRPGFSRLSHSPSPFALLSNFPAISLRRARLPRLPFLQESECPALPGFHAARLRLPRPPKPASRPARLSPDPALAQRDRRRKGIPRSCLKLVPRPRRSPRSVSPTIPESRTGRPRGGKRPLEGNGCPRLIPLPFSRPFFLMASLASLKA